MIEVSGVRSSCETRATNSSFSRSSSRSRSFWALSSPAWRARASSAMIWAVMSRVKRKVPTISHHAAASRRGIFVVDTQASAGGLEMSRVPRLPRRRLAGAYDLLCIPRTPRRRLLGEDFEVCLPDHLIRCSARGNFGEPALADEQEPAQYVLEVHPLLGVGQQVGHADELEFAQ